MEPLKVKIFSDCTYYINPSNEQRINAWLAVHPDIDIVNILQSESMIPRGDQAIERNLSISIFYR